MQPSTGTTLEWDFSGRVTYSSYQARRIFSAAKTEGSCLSPSQGCGAP